MKISISPSQFTLPQLLRLLSAMCEAAPPTGSRHTSTYNALIDTIDACGQGVPPDVAQRILARFNQRQRPR